MLEVEGEEKYVSRRAAVLQIMVFAPIIIILSIILNSLLNQIVDPIGAFVIAILPIVMYLILTPRLYRRFMSSNTSFPTSGYIEGVSAIFIGMIMMIPILLVPVYVIASYPFGIPFFSMAMAWILAGILEILVALVLGLDSKLEEP